MEKVYKPCANPDHKTHPEKGSGENFTTNLHHDGKGESDQKSNPPGNVR